MTKLLLTIALISATAFAADAPQPKLSDAQKLEARTLQLRFVLAQDAAQKANLELQDIQKSLMTLSAKVCGANAHLDLGKSATDDAACVANTPEQK